MIEGKGWTAFDPLDPDRTVLVNGNPKKLRCLTPADRAWIMAYRPQLARELRAFLVRNPAPRARLEELT